MTDHESQRPVSGDPLNLPAPVKLGRLDPARDPVAFDTIVRSITAGAIAARARAGAASAITVRTTVLAAIASWSAPAFAAAAVLLIGAGVAFTMLPTAAAAAPVSFAESAGISRSLVQWSADNHSPSPDELLGALDDRSARGAR
jgi:hypothetical protein